MIIVTGANGQLGRAITERLLQRVPAARLGVSVRNPEQASALAERGVRVRRGAFEDAASLRHAFEGASHVLIVSVNSTGEAAVRQHEAALEAARAAGARRVLYTSHMGSNPASHFAPMRDHAATEALLQRSGVSFTSLRNGFYAASGLMLLERALDTGKLVAPEDGPVSWTEHGDLADAAVIALTDEARLAGVTPPLTASAAFDLADIAAIASELIGRSIARVTVSDQAFRADMVSHGVPEQQADMLLGLFAASRQREFAAVDPTLEHLLGRAPMSMRQYLATRLSR
ncbi:NAD(P)H-binding protein [Sorangium sp. So ce1078]|uniref:NAD(P)H-binding protein n=1 Tax=Sorangium sp. So ce1078 TaxID=3133329 RepID=UPI003F60C3B1